MLSDLSLNYFLPLLHFKCSPDDVDSIFSATVLIFTVSVNVRKISEYLRHINNVTMTPEALAGGLRQISH